MKDNTVLVSVAVVFKGKQKDPRWFVVKNGDEWELPKTIARKGESSVRASIRMMAEQGGMVAKILEEIGRSGGAAKVDGKIATQKILYYLMMFKSGEEILGFEDALWLNQTKALRKLTQKRDKEMLKDAKKLLKGLVIKKDPPPAEEEEE